MASTRSWPTAVPQELRYIIQRKEGLIHVIRSRLYPAEKRPPAAAGSATAGEYAW